MKNPPHPGRGPRADLEALGEARAGRCAVSGNAFSEERCAGAFVPRPFAASLDRIDSARGYEPDNVRLVCTAVNFALGQWGHGIVRRLAHGIVETERREERAWFAALRRDLRRAEKAAEGLSGDALRKQRRVIAGLRAALTKGPARTGGAAIRAQMSRRGSDAT